MLSHKTMPTVFMYCCNTEPGMTHGTVASVYYYIIEDFKRILACFYLLPQSNKTVISKPYSHVKDPKQTDARWPQNPVWWDFVPGKIHLRGLLLAWFITKINNNFIGQARIQAVIYLSAGMLYQGCLFMINYGKDLVTIVMLDVSDLINHQSFSTDVEYSLLLSVAFCLFNLF